MEAFFMLRSMAVALLAAVSLSAANYFPLQNGNSWTYRVAGTSQQFTIRVGTPTLVDGEVWYSLNGYAQQRVLARYEGDRLMYLDEDTARPALFTSFLPGESWTAPLRQCRESGEAQAERVKVQSPTGPIENALQIRYTILGCADAGDVAEVYAENFGMLRRTVQSFGGPRVYELVSARLVSTAVETSPGGHFAVLLDDMTADHVALTLRLQATPTGPLKLTFPTGQEYDVVVRDPEGRIVYQWSDGRAFTQVLHSRELSEWTQGVSIPRPVPGAYTVQAWLTTDTRVPAYAATVALVVEPETGAARAAGRR
jgi:hypothetical protein